MWHLITGLRQRTEALQEAAAEAAAAQRKPEDVLRSLEQKLKKKEASLQKATQLVENAAEVERVATEQLQEARQQEKDRTAELDLMREELRNARAECAIVRASEAGNGAPALECRAGLWKMKDAILAASPELVAAAKMVDDFLASVQPTQVDTPGDEADGMLEDMDEDVLEQALEEEATAAAAGAESKVSAKRLLGILRQKGVGVKHKCDTSAGTKKGAKDKTLSGAATVAAAKAAKAQATAALNAAASGGRPGS